LPGACKQFPGTAKNIGRRSIEIYRGIVVKMGKAVCIDCRTDVKQNELYKQYPDYPSKN
jgi:hypothetical protein